MTNLTKTYKFVYWNNVGYYNRDLRSDFTFGSRMPSNMTCKYNVYEWFNKCDDWTMRKWFTDSKVRRVKSKIFLSRDMPANEANITLAFVKYFTYELNKCRRRLTYVNKHPEQFKNSGHSAASYKLAVKHNRENLQIWKQRYQTLKDQGVYTYLELMK